MQDLDKDPFEIVVPDNKNQVYLDQIRLEIRALRRDIQGLLSKEVDRERPALKEANRPIVEAGRSKRKRGRPRKDKAQ